MAIENILTGLVVSTQTPLDSKQVINNKRDITSLGQGNEKVFRYYENMRLHCLEDDKFYVWMDIAKAPATYVKVSVDFKYPLGHTANGIDYSNRSFAVYQIILPDPECNCPETDGKKYTFKSATGTEQLPYPEKGLIKDITSTPTEDTVTFKSLESTDLFLKYRATTGQLYIDTINRLYPWYFSNVIIRPVPGDAVQAFPDGTLIGSDIGIIREWLKNNPSDLNVQTIDRINVKFDTAVSPHVITNDNVKTFFEEFNVGKLTVASGAKVVTDQLTMGLISPVATGKEYTIVIEPRGELDLNSDNIIIDEVSKLTITGGGTITNVSNDAGYSIRSLTSTHRSLDINDVDVIVGANAGFLRSEGNDRLMNVNIDLKGANVVPIAITGGSFDVQGLTVHGSNESGLMRRAVGDSPIFEVDGSARVTIADLTVSGNTITSVVNVNQDPESITIKNVSLVEAEGLSEVVRSNVELTVAKINAFNNDFGNSKLTSENITVSNKRQTGNFGETTVLPTSLPEFQNREAAIAGGLPVQSLFINTKNGSVDKPLWFIDVVLPVV